MTGWPIYCARCGGPAAVLIEAGAPGTGHYRAETVCHRHEPASLRWASVAGPPHRTPLDNPAPIQAALFDVPEVTR